MEEDFIRDGRIFRRRDFIHHWLDLNLAVDGSMVRPRFSDDRGEQRRDNNESRRPMRDTRRRQEYMR